MRLRSAAPIVLGVPVAGLVVAHQIARRLQRPARRHLRRRGLGPAPGRRRRPSPSARSPGRIAGSSTSAPPTRPGSIAPRLDRLMATRLAELGPCATRSRATRASARSRARRDRRGRRRRGHRPDHGGGDRRAARARVARRRRRRADRDRRRGLPPRRMGRRGRRPRDRARPPRPRSPPARGRGRDRSRRWGATTPGPSSRTLTASWRCSARRSWTPPSEHGLRSPARARARRRRHHGHRRDDDVVRHLRAVPDADLHRDAHVADPAGRRPPPGRGPGHRRAADRRRRAGPGPGRPHRRAPPTPASHSAAPAFALWGASRGAASLGRALNRMFNQRETRSWWWRQVLAILVTLAVAGLSVIVLALLLIGP